MGVFASNCAGAERLSFFVEMTLQRLWHQRNVWWTQKDVRLLRMQWMTCPRDGVGFDDTQTAVRFSKKQRSHLLDQAGLANLGRETHPWTYDHLFFANSRPPSVIETIPNDKSVCPPGRRCNLIYALCEHAGNLGLNEGDVLLFVATRFCSDRFCTVDWTGEYRGSGDFHFQEEQFNDPGAYKSLWSSTTQFQSYRVMLSENVKPESNMRNKVFCDSEGNSVGLWFTSFFAWASPEETRESPFAKAVTLRFVRTSRPSLAAVEALIKQPVDPVSIIAWTCSLLPADLILKFRLALGRPVLHKTAALSSSSSDDCCKTAAVDLHTDAQSPTLEHLWQVPFLAGHFELGCCYRPQNWQRGRSLFATCWAEGPGRSGHHRVVWENSFAAATVENSSLRKNFENSLDSSIAHASDMQLSISALESSSSNSLARMSSDLSPDIKVSRTRYSWCAWTVRLVHSQASTSRFGLSENCTMYSSSFWLALSIWWRAKSTLAELSRRVN